MITGQCSVLYVILEKSFFSFFLSLLLYVALHCIIQYCAA